MPRSSRYLLETELGYTVEKKNLAEQVSWEGFPTGDVDVILENWGHDDLKAKYIDTDKTAQSAGELGVTGIIGWYVPAWMKVDHPDIDDWNNLNKYADLFKTSESGDKGQLLDGDPSYVTNDVALVKNLNLNYEVVVGGSEAALITSFQQATTQKTAAPRLLLRPAVGLVAAAARRRRRSSGSSCPSTRPAATPTRRRSPATTRRTSSTRSSARSSRPRAARPTS